MPVVPAGGLRQYYRFDGVDGRPLVFFAHSLGCDHTQWDPQSAALSPRYGVLRYDLRGHGATEVTPGDYSIELLARDALALADALAIRQFAFCGLSLGGMIAQWLAANSPERITGVVLANTSSRFPDPSAMETRRRTVLEQGMDTVADAAMGRFFSPERLAANPPEAAGVRRVLRATDPRGYAGCCAAVRDMDQTSMLSSIRRPTLMIVGERDLSTPWSGHGDVIAHALPDAEIVRLPTAHLSNLEDPQGFNAALMKFLQRAS